MKLKILIPVLIAVAGVLDVSGRFLAQSRFTFRAWEAMCRYPWALGPFGPGSYYHSTKAHGDLPSLGNIPGFVQLHEERFTVDGQGFRTNGAEPDRPWGALALGDSFTAGSTLSDEETLPSELERRTGMGIFNTADLPIKTENALNVARRIGLSSGTVMYVYMERQPLPTPRDVSGVTRAHRYGAGDPWNFRRFKQVSGALWDGFWKITPLEILSRRAFKQIQNDRIFPNPYKAVIRTGTLQNGEKTLFWAADAARHDATPPVDVAGLVALRDGLAEKNFRLVMVLVPTKYTVFRPLLETTPAGNPGEDYLARLEMALRAGGVPVLNLTPKMLAEARNRMPEGRYLYWHDDSHWNADGVRLAADEIMKARLLERTS